MKYILLFLPLYLLAGCTGLPQGDYREALSFFPAELVDHFPDERRYGIYSWGYFDKNNRLFHQKYTFGFSSILLSEDFRSKDKFDVEMKQIMNEAKQSYSAADSIMLFVFYYNDKLVINGQVRNFRDSESDRTFPFIAHNKGVGSGLPVPLVGWSKYAGNTLSGLDDSFTYYVLDAKQGKYLPDEYLNEPEVSIMPPEWVHGYTKGAAVSEKFKTIIYWIAVW
jgi:hypothetical protein